MPLYVKAAVGSIGPRASTLPDGERSRDGVSVDRGHLADYARVCGFPVEDALPPTYPHVLAFPLQVELMADRSVPATAARAGAHAQHDHRAPCDRRGEPLACACTRSGSSRTRRARRSTSSPRVDADGEPVWRGRSTYLARGAHGARRGRAAGAGAAGRARRSGGRDLAGGRRHRPALRRRQR